MKKFKSYSDKLLKFWSGRSSKEKWLLAIVLFGIPVYGYITHLQNQVHRYKQEAMNRLETLEMVQIERGVTRSQQDILSKKDLDKLANGLSKDLAELKKELRKGQVEAVTQIKLNLDSGGTTIDLEPVKEVGPDLDSEWDKKGSWVPNTTMWIRDDWVNIQVKVPQFEVLSTEYAPIELAIIEHQDKDGRAQYVVAKNGWTGDPIDQIEISRSVLQNDVFDPYFSIGIGTTDQAPFIALSRHTSRNSFWQGALGYNLADKGLSFSASYHFALKWPW